MKLTSSITRTFAPLSMSVLGLQAHEKMPGFSGLMTLLLSNTQLKPPHSKDNFKTLQGNLIKLNEEIKNTIDSEIEALKTLAHFEETPNNSGVTQQEQRDIVEWILNFVKIARQTDTAFETNNSDKADLRYNDIVTILNKADFRALGDYLTPDTENNTANNLISDAMMAFGKNRPPADPFFQVSIDAYTKFTDPNGVHSDLRKQNRTIG